MERNVIRAALPVGHGFQLWGSLDWEQSVEDDRPQAKPEPERSSPVNVQGLALEIANRQRHASLRELVRRRGASRPCPLG